LLRTTAYNLPFPHDTLSALSPVSTLVHRFEERIAGKPYLIEASEVGQGRWRAYIVRLPGVPTALMPFYGPTAADAAGQLRQWLTCAHERAATNTRRV
jgi:hypothetical protein